MAARSAAAQALAQVKVADPSSQAFKTPRTQTLTLPQQRRRSARPAPPPAWRTNVSPAERAEKQKERVDVLRLRAQQRPTASRIPLLSPAARRKTLSPSCPSSGSPDAVMKSVLQRWTMTAGGRLNLTMHRKLLQWRTEAARVRALREAGCAIRTLSSASALRRAMRELRAAADENARTRALDARGAAHWTARWQSVALGALCKMSAHASALRVARALAERCALREMARAFDALGEPWRAAKAEREWRRRRPSAVAQLQSAIGNLFKGAAEEASAAVEAAAEEAAEAAYEAYEADEAEAAAPAAELASLDVEKRLAHRPPLQQVLEFVLSCGSEQPAWEGGGCERPEGERSPATAVTSGE